MPHAATATHGDSGKDIPLESACPSPWGSFQPGQATMCGYNSDTDSELWEWVTIENDEEKEEEGGGGGGGKHDFLGALSSLESF